MRAVHRFVWGYGPSGYDIVFRQGEGRALEAPCVEEIGRWKLDFDREAQVVTPVRAGGEPVALLAFKSRVTARAAGDKFRETACAAVAWEHAAEDSMHRRLLDLVPPFCAGGDSIAREAGRVSPAAGGDVDRAAPARAAPVWARLLEDDAVIMMNDAGASLAEALHVVALLPPAVARGVAVGDGLLPGARPRAHGLYIANVEHVHRQGAAGPEVALLDQALDGPLEELAQAWFRREIPAHTRGAGSAARELWDRCAAEAGCSVAQFDKGRLVSAMLSDAALDGLLQKADTLAAASLAGWLDAGLAAGINPDPGRLADLIDALPLPERGEAVRRMPHLASKLVALDSRHAVVMVGAAVEDALQRARMEERELAFFDPHTWIGAVLLGLEPKPRLAPLAAAAWPLVGELLALWAAQEPGALAIALARPARGAAEGPASWLQRLARRLVRPRTTEDVLRRLAKRPTPAVPGVPQRLLPAALRTAQGRSALKPHPEVLENLFAVAVLTAASTGRKRPNAVAAVAPLMPRPLPSAA